MKEVKIITDLHGEYHGETGEVFVVVEYPDGKEETICTVYKEKR